MKISELASVLRSKNAGPFRTTLDMFFDDEEKYTRVKIAGKLTKEYIAGLYGIRPESVCGVYFVDSCMGIKITMLKRRSEYSGEPECRDILGSQQHIRLMDVDIP